MNKYYIKQFMQSCNDNDKMILDDICTILEVDASMFSDIPLSSIVYRLFSEEFSNIDYNVGVMVYNSYCYRQGCKIELLYGK